MRPIACCCVLHAVELLTATFIFVSTYNAMLLLSMRCYYLCDAIIYAMLLSMRYSSFLIIQYYLISLLNSLFSRLLN